MSNPIKVAVLVEGQGELIFLRNVLRHVLTGVNYSLECLELRGRIESPVPLRIDNPNACIHYMIVNIGNDKLVISAMKEREQVLYSKGFSKIIGLRDMYSQEYRESSPSAISQSINDRFIKGHNASVQTFQDPTKVRFFFSIMEIEAWWLSMYNYFQKINPALSVGNINSQLNINLQTSDVEKLVFHPASLLNKVYKLIGKDYKKKFSDVESITSRMDLQDVLDAIENGRCKNFGRFLEELIDGAYAEI